MHIDYTARLLTGELTPAQRSPHHRFWYVTHGLGSPAAGTFTEFRIPSSVPATDDEIEMVIRKIATELYGNHWAFIYRHDQYERCIGRFDMRCRERVLLTGLTVQEEV